MQYYANIAKKGTMHNFDISKRDSWLIAKCKQKHLDFSSTFQFVQGHSGKAGSIKVFLEVSKFRIKHCKFQSCRYYKFYSKSDKINEYK